MLKGLPFVVLPIVPNLSRISAKIALGVVALTFLLGYQPTLTIPPIKQTAVLAQTEQTPTIEAKSLPFTFQKPHPGYLSTYFSNYHPGIDLAAGLGMPVKPIAPGIITEAGYSLWGYGLMVEIDHGQGYRSLYAHLGQIYVKKGQNISGSDLLGIVGLTGHTTGPHTHLEVNRDNKKIDPLLILPK